VSYDPVATLTRFADVHGITYPLLADVGSVAITELGLLNVTLAAERAAYGRPIEDRHTGIPYPGTFFLDETGVVASKRFETSHRIRPTGKTLLRELLGSDAVPPEVTAEASSPGIEIFAWLDTAVLHGNQMQEAHVRIQMDDGLHMYTDPVPEGFRALSVELTGDSQLRPDAFTIPEGTPFRVEGLSEEFTVLEGRVDLDIPFILITNRDTAGDAVRQVTLVLELAYQACTAQECFLPERVTLELPLSVEPNPGYESLDRAALAPLVNRRIVEQPRQFEELLGLVNSALEGVEASPELLMEVLREMQGDGIVELSSQGRWTQSS